MLTLDKTLLKILHSNRLSAFKRGSRHYFRSYPKPDNWDICTEVEVPGRVHGADWNDTERGTCSCSIPYTSRDLLHLLKIGDAIELEWWPDCNSPWLDKLSLHRDVLFLIVHRKEGKRTRRMELILEEELTGPDNASIRMCQDFPTKRRSCDAA